MEKVDFAMEVEEEKDEGFPFKSLYEFHGDSDVKKRFKQLIKTYFDCSFKAYSFKMTKLNPDSFVDKSFTSKNGVTFYQVKFSSNDFLNRRINKLCSKLPNKDEFFFSIFYDNGNYKVDVLSDYFNEKERVKAKKSFKDLSVYDFYMQNKQDIEGKTPKERREDLYRVYKNGECEQYKPTVGLFLIRLFSKKGSSILDFSAGWGDRLISAIANDSTYLGFDPNKRLKKGHSNIIRLLGNKNKQKIIYKPSEEIDYNRITDAYDLIFTSPPFYKLEIYSEDETQSVNLHKDINSWLKDFLFYSLFNCWKKLKINGYMILYIGDYNNVPIVEPTLYYISCFLKGSEYLGAIGLQLKNKNRPTFIIRKNEASFNKKNYKLFRKSFSDTYPELYNFIK